MCPSEQTLVGDSFAVFLTSCVQSAGNSAYSPQESLYLEAWPDESRENPHLICKHFSELQFSDTTLLLCLHTHCTHLVGCGSGFPSDSVSLSKAGLWQEKPMNWWGGGCLLLPVGTRHRAPFMSWTGGTHISLFCTLHFLRPSVLYESGGMPQCRVQAELTYSFLWIFFRWG